ncbi:MAG TPA: DUF6508 domain-containing protein [Fimbriimonadaceae bacterium]|nr:DUF6508 domain-containing protein [Fimbriimonadaceae bacterium]
MSQLTEAELAAIDALLELLPTFEDPAFVPGTWPDRSYVDQQGVRCQSMPYPDYHPAVEEFRHRYPAMAGSVHPYHALPEDESPGGVPFNVLGTSYPIEYFETATLNQVRRYFMLLGRGERFCDGHIDGEFRSGKIVAALRRVAFLRAEQSG